MKIKKIMLITLMLLAVLTIAAVSAADDVASDGVNATDESDITVTGDYDLDYHGIEVETEDAICIDESDDEYDEDAEVASITLPGDTTKGSFQIHNGQEQVACVDVDLNDDDHWEEDDGDVLGSIYLSDLDMSKISNGDNISFMFFEYNGGDLVPVDDFTIVCNVVITGTNMILIEIEDGTATDDEFDIHVKNIDLNNPDENFTNVSVGQKDGLFKISIEGDNEDYVIFQEDLSTTGRPYVKTKDGNGSDIYTFSFSLDDLNAYIKGHTSAVSFVDFVDKYNIDPESEIYFGVYEDEDDTETEPDAYVFTINDGWIIFVDEESVDVDYKDLNVIISGDWLKTEVLEYSIRNDINGNIIIYLNDSETPAFNKTLSELTPDDSDDDCNYYIITVEDLNITQAGDYVIRDFFYDEDGVCIYQYDADDPETLKIYEDQIVTENNVTIKINPAPILITSNEWIIKINASAEENDEVLIYVDGNDEAITIPLSACVKDDDGNYIITPGQLNIGIGEYTINVSCQGVNAPGNINLTFDLVIALPDEDEIIYTTFNDVFVIISLEDGDIYEFSAEINVTITDNEGNVIASIEDDIAAFHYDEEEFIFEICTDDMNAELNGTFTVVVRYIHETIGEITEEGSVIFKPFDPEEFGISIADTVENETFPAITFSSLPEGHAIIVEVDGIQTPINETNIGYDAQSGMCYIKNDCLNGLSEGAHSIKVYINAGGSPIELVSGNILVDTEEDVDPQLTISVANITAGEVANIVITTNSTYTGVVTVEVAGKNYTVNVTEGKGTLPISGLAENTYTAVAIFKSNGIFANSTKNATFTVVAKPASPAASQGTTSQTASQTQDSIKLTLKKVKVKKSAKKLVLKATLKINGKAKKGLKVTFKFNGKKFKAKTNKKGVAKVTIKKKYLKKLKVGKKVKYQVSYKNVTKKRTVKVKK
jgi:uncharacterized protein (UPF0218 family)